MVAYPPEDVEFVNQADDPHLVPTLEATRRIHFLKVFLDQRSAPKVRQAVSKKMMANCQALFYMPSNNANIEDLD